MLAGTTLGLRVPAIAISSHTLPGTVVNQPLHHAAVINTLLQKFVYTANNQPFLTLRDKGLNGGDLSGAYNGTRTAPWPPFTKSIAAPAVPDVPCKT